ncbi:MAG: hypothetical protein FWE15_10495 [Actinomycetia bacterium]|nr:hypothetical protein [Actinomycetes bacterium]MCL2730438.1 hypothetical protein [Actinomycetes bacterium]
MSASLSAGQPPGSRAGLRLTPPVVVAAFLLLLAAVFAVAYAAGSVAGPVNPRMHPARTGVPVDGDGGTGGMDGMR